MGESRGSAESKRGSDSARTPAGGRQQRAKYQTLPEYPTPTQKSYLVVENTLRDLVPGKDFDELEEQLTREWLSPELGEPTTDDGTAQRTVGGRYTVVEGMASGGMGQVYHVVHRELGRPFALKIVDAKHADHADTRSAFFHEARTLSQLEHPGIVQVTDFGHDHVYGAFLVMEYLRGESLANRLLRKGRLGVSLSLQVAIQVAEALDYMHQQQLIHCDIKPENVFLVRPPPKKRQRPIAKLIDFGLARSRVTDAAVQEALLGGTPEFSAPEQFSSRVPEPTMDIYAVGTLLYEMLTGRLPFEGPPEQIVAQKTCREPPPPSKHLEAPITGGLESLVLKALARDPRERPQNMEQLIFELWTQMDMLGLTRPDRRRHTTRNKLPVRPVTGMEHGRQDGRRLHSPFPRFRCDRAGQIQRASRSFARLMSVALADLAERPLRETRLGNIYPDVDRELAQAAELGEALQRTIVFSTDDGGMASVLVWLVPQLDGEGQVSGFEGIVVPVKAAADE